MAALGHTASCEGQPAVVIVGASTGIGRALAEEFARHGHRLIIIARSADALRQAAGQLAAKHQVEVHVLSLDITSDDAADRIVALAGRTGLYIDTLVLNAALWAEGPLDRMQRGRLRRVVDTNISAVGELAIALLPAMVARGRGNILVTGSLAGDAPGPFNAVYAASKAFLRSWTLSLRYEVRAYGINVSLLTPGTVDSAFTLQGPERASDRGRRFWSTTPEAVAWLAYRGLSCGQGVIVPGLLWRIIRLGTFVMPDRLLAHIRGRLSEHGAQGCVSGPGR